MEFTVTGNPRFWKELLYNLIFFVFQDEEEWPSLSVFELSNTDLSVARRDVSHDSGIHEISEEKRRSVKRIE